MQPIQGLHHVTAVARDAQRNVDFYRNVLGQRLVKKTVNFDVTDTYHFYFADATGTPGAVMTFFAWPNTRRAVRGNGTTAALTYNVPAGALGFWQEHLRRSGVAAQEIEKRFGADVLPFDDPDGLRLELVESESAAATNHWQDGPIDPRYALQGFNGVTLWHADAGPTAGLLSGLMGYTLSAQEGSRLRLNGGNGALGSVVDILERPGGSSAVFGAGSIHHIAFRVADDPSQLAYQAALRAAGLGVTEVRDRSYFHSIYWNEPGGVLFEIATANPGFAIDEAPESLGEALRLPHWLESQREQIASGLSPLTLKPIQKAEYAPDL